MRVFYENLIGTVENFYGDKSTMENFLYLEDIINTITTDIYVQYKSKIANTIVYQGSSIDLMGIVKIRNHLYFINYYRSTYNNFNSFETNKDNYIKIRIKNVNMTTGNPYEIEILLNDVLIETLINDDQYIVNNKKTIQFQSTILGTSINVTQPLYLSVGQYVTYRIYTINVTEEAALHKYLCTFDKINNALIFDRKYSDYSISVLLQTKGSILRSSTINDLYRLNSNAFIQYDENTNKLIIPLEKLYKEGDKLKYVKTQYIIIDPHQIMIGYNLLGIYLTSDGSLAYDNIINAVNYGTLMSQVNNYSLDNLRKTRQYYGFIVGINNINTFTPLDVHFYGIGTGGSGGGGASKVSQEITDELEIKIAYAAGTEVPLVAIFDNQGKQIVPEEIQYNLNNEITIKFGELFSGQVSII